MSDEARKDEAEKLKDLTKGLADMSKKHTEELKSLEQKLERKNDKRRKLSVEVKNLGEVIRLLREQQAESKRKEEVEKLLRQQEETGSQTDNERKYLALNSVMVENQIRLSWGVYTGGVGLGVGGILVGLSSIFKTFFPDGINRI